MPAIDPPFRWSPEKRRAAELVAAYPGMMQKEIAARVSVHPRTVMNWLQSPFFIAGVANLRGSPDRIAAIKAKFEAETAGATWTPVTTPPPFGLYVEVVYTPLEGTPIVTMGKLRMDGVWAIWIDEKTILTAGVTDWQYLPKLPGRA